jgi:hypothetical protein
MEEFSDADINAIQITSASDASALNDLLTS